MSLDLAGKDYFTEQEAAHYCCVSHSHFRAQAVKHGIAPRWFMGKKVYRRADLARAIEASWQQFGFEEAPTSSVGRTRRASSARPSAKSP